MVQSMRNVTVPNNKRGLTLDEKIVILQSLLKTLKNETRSVRKELSELIGYSNMYRKEL